MIQYVLVTSLSLLFLLQSFSLKAQTLDCESSQIACMMDSLLAHYNNRVKTRMYNRNPVKNIYGYSEGEVPRPEPQVIKERLQKLGYEIPMAYNEHVQSFIDLYTVRRRDQVERMLGLTKVYFPIFEESLDKAGLPMEFKHLAIVESALNPHAVSRMGATGIWQFMFYTGKIYNLEINTFVDERRDPFKSSAASSEYFKNMYKIYKDWLLVIAAYNCGPGNVNKAIRRSGGKTNFWDISPYLPAETRGYVPAFIAACYVFNYPAEHNLYPIPTDFTYHQDTMHVIKCKMDLKELAVTTGVDYEVLKDLNPELKTQYIPYSDDGYVLRVPAKVSLLAATNPESVFKNTTASIETISAASAAASPATMQPTAGSGQLRYHTVRSGEVVGAIAKKYGVTASQISSWNKLRNYRIVPGQKLKIYGGKSTSRS
jgi:membrane-bound lytic murein transglycosylase D